MARRAESLEAQELVLQATQGGWPPQRILWQFLSSQWPTAVGEGVSRFGLSTADFRALLKDQSAMAQAVEAMAVDLLLTRGSHDVVDDVKEVLQGIAAEEGWTDWSGPAANVTGKG